MLSAELRGGAGGPAARVMAILLERYASQGISPLTAAEGNMLTEASVLLPLPFASPGGIGAGSGADVPRLAPGVSAGLSGPGTPAPPKVKRRRVAHDRDRSSMDGVNLRIYATDHGKVNYFRLFLYLWEDTPWGTTISRLPSSSRLSEASRSSSSSLFCVLFLLFGYFSNSVSRAKFRKVRHAFSQVYEAYSIGEPVSGGRCGPHQEFTLFEELNGSRREEAAAPSLHPPAPPHAPAGLTAGVSRSRRNAGSPAVHGRRQRHVVGVPCAVIPAEAGIHCLKKVQDFPGSLRTSGLSAFSFRLSTINYQLSSSCAGLA